MEMLTEERTTQRQMAIVERFEGFINYMYPIALNIPRAHYVARDRLVSLMFEQVSMFYQAAKSNQVSKLYLADALLSPQNARSPATGASAMPSRFPVSLPHGAATRSGPIRSTCSTV